MFREHLAVISRKEAKQKGSERNEKKDMIVLLRSLLFYTFASVRVTQTSKAMQTTAIRTVAKSLPESEVIFLTLLISKRYISYTDLHKLIVICHFVELFFTSLL